MVKKLKAKKENNKISKQGVKFKCDFKQEYEDTVLFSFKYITTQNSYNLEGFKRSKNIRNDISIINDFYDCLSKMSEEGWEKTRQKGKYQGGVELLPYSEIRFNAYDPNNELKLASDSKVWVIRFGGNKYRLIGYKNDKCQFVFHILGIDHDFSAYNHGK